MELPEVSLKDITLQDQQGKEDAQMLRPIHRKGFPGKTSEKARSGVNKTWVPERFDSADSLGLSPKAVSIPRPKLQIPCQGAVRAWGRNLVAVLIERVLTWI